MNAVAIITTLIGLALWRWRLAAVFACRARPGGGAPPRVSIIIPARDEAHNLPALLASLARLRPAAAEVIVVDDHSSDDTAEIARAHGARVVSAPPLPPGWLGKSWACHTGARVATGELLLFTDADTVHAPDSLGRAVAELERTGADLISVVPTHRVRALWERLQGVFHLLLLVACRAGTDAPRDRGERRFSVGQYLLFRRAAYRRIGGHETIKGRVAEDLALAARIERAGGRFSLVFAPGMMSVRMYPEGLGAFVQGWRRSFREGMASAGVLGVVEMILVMIWLIGVPVEFGRAAAAGAGLPAAAWAVAYGLTAAEIAWQQRRLGRFPAWSGLGYPIFAVLFVWVSLLAVSDRLRRAPVTWKGRSLPW